MKPVLIAAFIAILLLFCAGLAACKPKSKQVPQQQSVTIDSPYFTENDRVLTVDGLSIRYRDEGPKSAQPLIMVHGFSSSLETWNLLAAELSADYRVIRFDLPGHGLTGADSEGRYSNEETAAFLAGFVQALNLKTKPVIIGNSLGGLAAWRMAANHPEMADKLVLISPGGFSINGVTDKPGPVPPMVSLYLKTAPMSGVTYASKALFADPEKLPKSRIETTRDLMKHGDNGDAMVKRLKVFTLPAPEADLAKVQVPTLILWGDKDTIVPPDHAQGFLGAMPNAKLISYENIGHVPQEEAPAQTAADIRAFITGQ